MPMHKVQLHLKMSKNEIFDHEFLATVDREWEKLRDGKLPNLEILTFENEDRGMIKGRYAIHA